MHRIKRFLGSLLVVIVFLVTFSAAKDYKIVDVNITARILPNGNMQIEEYRTYYFDGSFSWATYRLPLRDDYTVSNFAISEKKRGVNYRLTDSYLTDTFTVEESGRSIEAKWFYEATDEFRTFTISYTAENAVKVYKDIAELYWKFVGEGWDHPSGNVLVTVIFSDSVGPEQLKAWAHGPGWGKANILKDGRVQLVIENLPAKQMWEGRILFPVGLVPFSQRVENVYMFDTIFKEETRRIAVLEEERLRFKKYAGVSKTIFSIITLLGFIVWLFLFIKYGKEYPYQPHVKLISQPPSHDPPAIVDYLINSRSVTARAFIATILDLCRKGYIQIEELVRKEKGLFRVKEKRDYTLKRVSVKVPEEESMRVENNSSSAPDSLILFEKRLYSFIFDELAGGEDIISFSDFKKRSSKVRKFFSKWSKIVKEYGKSKGYFEKRSINAMFAGFITGAGIIGSSIPFIKFLEVYFLIPLIGGIAIILLSLFLTRRSREGNVLYRKWLAFKRYLKQFGFRQIDYSSVQEYTDAYLIYGLVLGLNARKLKQMIKYFEEEGGVFPWFYAYAGAPQAGLAESIGGMISAASTSIASSTGAAGGGGAGGGGSGGSAG